MAFFHYLLQKNCSLSPVAGLFAFSQRALLLVVVLLSFSQNHLHSGTNIDIGRRWNTGKTVSEIQDTLRCWSCGRSGSGEFFGNWPPLTRALSESLLITIRDCEQDLRQMQDHPTTLGHRELCPQTMDWLYRFIRILLSFFMFASWLLSLNVFRVCSTASRVSNMLFTLKWKSNSPSRHTTPEPGSRRKWQISWDVRLGSTIKN